MKEFELADFLQFLTQYQFELAVGIVIVIAVFFVLLVVYFVRKRAASPAVADKIREYPAKAKADKTPSYSFEEDLPLERNFVDRAKPAKPQSPAIEQDLTPEPSAIKAKPVDTQSQTTVRYSPPKPRRVEAETIPAKPPAVAAKTAGSHAIPQDSTLRRHYLTHVRYMAETVNSPRPSESVLRRHYEQLITSQVDACLHDGAQMTKLLDRYDEHRRSAAKRAV